MKNKIAGLLVAGVAVFTLSGCGGGSGGTDVVVISPVTHYLHTWDPVTGEFYGVPDVEYQCGPDPVRFTDISGSFVYVPGDDCIFYDLDDRLSLSINIDELYMSAESTGQVWVSVDYDCDSGNGGRMNTDGLFLFDPFWTLSGDTCRFHL